MSIFSNPHFRNHERVVFGHDAESGLKAIIAIHNTRRGPALGGCRIWPYATEDDALADVLRLSLGMTYKAALAGLPLGGGKAVIIGDPRRDKTDALLRSMGRFVESLGGRYITAEDSGTGVEDLRTMGRETRHVVGIARKTDEQGRTHSGDPSPATAHGVFVGIRATVAAALGRDDLDGVRVAVQGLGNVGYRVARMLHQAGARLWVTDIYPDGLERARDELGATVVEPDAIFDQDVDVFAPCALGAAIDDNTLPRLRARAVAGAANNQLAEARHGEALRERGILYAPDYVINAGGVIDVASELEGYDAARVRRRVEAIAETLGEIYARARREQRPTSEVADRIAEERFGRHGASAAA